MKHEKSKNDAMRHELDHIDAKILNLLRRRYLQISALVLFFRYRKAKQELFQTIYTTQCVQKEGDYYENKN